MFGRRRPLLCGAVAGAGYAIGRRVSRESDQAATDEQDHAATEEVVGEEEAAPAEALADEKLDELEKLGTLKDDGVLTPDEFDQHKQLILAS